MIQAIGSFFSTSLGVVVTYAVLLIVQLFALAIIPARRRPAAAQAWLLLIFFLPPVGWLLYLLVGNPKLSRRRRQFQQQADAFIVERIRVAQSQPDYQALLKPPITPSIAGLVRLNERAGRFPAFGGNDVVFIPDYNDTFHRIAADIDRAKHYVHIEYYALVMDDATECIFAAMERATERGVQVRVLFDHLGSLSYPNRRAMHNRLAASGIEYHRMLPVSFFDNEFSRADLRNHRKIVIVDGHVGFTGSQNLVKETYHRTDELRYEELVARVSGPVAAQLEAVFATDWFAETGVTLDQNVSPELAATFEPAGTMLAQVVPSGPGYDGENNWRLFVALIHEAREKLVITTPYFVPDESLMAAITIASLRGVDVSLIVSGKSDQFLVSRAQRSYYDELLEAGVALWEFNPPELLHAKTMSIDDDVAVIGSSNMDIRSFSLNLEVTLVLYDAVAVERLRAIEATYIERSTAVELQQWEERPFTQKFVENTVRLVSAVL